MMHYSDNGKTFSEVVELIHTLSLILPHALVLI